MKYRLAERKDIDFICNIVTSAITEMKNNNIFQWDEPYPSKEDFLVDIDKKNLFVGMFGTNGTVALFDNVELKLTGKAIEA